MKKCNYILFNFFLTVGILFALEAFPQNTISSVGQEGSFDLEPMDSVTCIRIGRPNEETIIKRTIEKVIFKGKEYDSLKIKYCPNIILPIKDMSYEDFIKIIEDSNHLILSSTNSSPENSPAREKNQYFEEEEDDEYSLNSNTNHSFRNGHYLSF